MSLLDERFSDKFYDKWEVVSPGARSEIICEKLRDYAEYARSRVPFYQERLSSFQGDSPWPLKKVPPLSSAQMRELLPPRSDTLVARKDLPYTVFQSGGTTGAPKTTLFSHEELEMLNLPNARGFFALGLRRDDRVANLFAVGGLYMTFIHINRMLQQFGCVNFPFSDKTPADFVHGVTKLFNINVFTGITSVVLDCLRKMGDIGLDGISIEKVFYGGEHIYDSDRKELRERFSVKLVAAPGYGTVDTWYIGYQCLECGPGVFHAHDDQCYIEFLNEETGEHCAPGEAGMLYATAFCRLLTPIIRYQVGDRGMWLGEECRCGRTTPLFRLLGRGDDVLRIGYDSVDYSFIQEVAGQVEALHGTIQMEKKREEGKDRLVIRIETKALPSEYESIARIIEEKILEGRPSLRGFINKGTVLPLQIELLKPGEIQRSVRTGKLRRVIDLM